MDNTITDNIENLLLMLKNVRHKEIQNDNGIIAVSECVDYVTLAHINSDASKEEFGFIFFDLECKNPDGTPVYRFVAQSPSEDPYGLQVLELINENGTDIDFSTISGSFQTIEDTKNSYTKLLSADTNGVNIAKFDYETVVTNCLHHIYGDAIPNVGVYKAIIATGYTDVVLDKPLTKYDMELAEKLYNDPEYVFSADELADCADTDEDGLTEQRPRKEHTSSSGRFCQSSICGRRRSVISDTIPSPK